MRTRDEVLREEPTIVSAARQHVARCSHKGSDRVIDGSAVFLQDNDTYYRVGDLLAAYDALADRIRELEAPQAASEPVAWAMYTVQGDLYDLYVEPRDSDGVREDGDRLVPLYAHPSAAGVTVTEAMVDAFMAAYAKCEQDNEWIFTHRMGVREAMCAALDAAEGTP